MSRVPEEQILAFLLGEMSPAERQAFENRMRKDPELWAAVSEQESVLAESVVNSLPPAPVSGDLWSRIGTRLDAEAQDGSGADEGMPEKSAFTARYRHWIPATLAAILLIGISGWVALLGLRMQAELEHGADAPVAVGERSHGWHIGENGQPVLTDFDDWRLEDIPHLLTRIERMERAIETREALIETKERRIAALERDRDELEDDHAYLAHSYRQLDQQLAELYDEDPGLARFTVIELVDARTFARGGERRGLAEVARQFLMSPAGLLVGSPQEEVYYYPAEEDAYVGAEPGDMPMVAAGTAVDQAPSIEDLGWEFETVSGDHARFESVSGVENPLAFTVWSEEDQRGFLDVYNLPEIPSDEVAQLWLRGAGSDSYMSVGVLPDLERGTGSLFYSVEDIEFTPREVMITLEAGSGSNVPSGRVLLRGP